MRDVLSGVAEMAWDVLSGPTKMAWDVLSGVKKNLHGMFCPGWQIDAGCFVQGGKKWHGMFCPGMFCPTFPSAYLYKSHRVLYGNEWENDIKFDIKHIFSAMTFFISYTLNIQSLL